MTASDTGDPRSKGTAPVVGLLLTGGLIVLLGLFDYTGQPVPGRLSIALLPVVYTTYVGGMGYGLASGMLLILYGVWRFSTPGELFTYTQAGAAHHAASSVVTLITVLLVSMLRRRSERISETLRAKADLEARLDEQRQLHDELETRVGQRTAELAAANRSLQREIDEHARTEKELAESEERFASLLHSVDDVVWAATAERSKMLYINSAAERVYGRTVAEFFENPRLWAEVVHPDDRERAERSRRELLELGHTEVVYRIVRPDGEIRWLNDRKSVVFDDAGKPLRIGGIATDVTDRVMAEEGLRESTAALEKLAEEQKTLLEHTRDFLYRHDTKGVFTYLSPSVEQITGYPVDEWCKHYTTYMTDSPINEQVIPKTEETLRTGKEGPPYLVEVRHRNGRPIVLEVSERPYFEGDQVAGIIGVARDVTERVRAEEALRQSEELLHAIIDSTPAVIYVKDLEGRYVLANRRFEELFHLERGEAVGKTDHDIFPADVADAFRANDRQVLEGGDPVEFEEVAPHDATAHTYVSLKFPLYDASGEPTNVCGISTDITDRKRAADALQGAKDAAEAANRAKSSFLANISHEIRTPITAMLGAAELIRAEQTEQLEMRQRADMILRNGRHLMALVNDLLDLSRIDAGKLEVHPTLCPFLDILEDVDALTAPLRLDDSVEYRVIYETDIPERIHTDRTRLTQAVVNLVNNALKFTSAGHVYLRVRVDRGADDPRLVIAVEDTGPGIGSEHLERVFETFAQVDASIRNAVTGVGLGLPISRWIAEQLGGTLTVDSTPGEGSTFRLRVGTGPVEDVEWVDPREVGSKAITEDRAAPGNHGPQLRGTILVAEDADDNRLLLDKALSAAGADVTTAGDGRAAVELAARQPFDLILLDIRMPVMDGMTAAAKLRRSGFRAALIALTASASDSEMDRILGAGFDDVWCKPISLEELVDRVAPYLDEASDNADLTSAAEVRESQSTLSEQMSTVATDFAKSLPTRVQRLRRAVLDRDDGEAHEVLHQLVGTSGMHGHMTISNEAARLMALLKRGVLLNRPAELRQLEAMTRSIVVSASCEGAAGERPASAAAHRTGNRCPEGVPPHRGVRGESRD